MSEQENPDGLCSGCEGKGWLDYPERKHGPCRGTGLRQSENTASP
jgi:hypothetical protein